MKEATNQGGISQSLKEIREQNGTKQREKMDPPRIRRVSAPAKSSGGSEIREKKLEQKLSEENKRSQSGLLITPSLHSLEGEEIDSDQLDTSWDFIEEIMKDTKKAQKAESIKLLKTRRFSAPAKTLGDTETTETTTTFKQLRKEIARRFSRTRSESTCSLIPWMDCFDWEQPPVADFEPVEFNLGFLDDFM